MGYVMAASLRIWKQRADFMGKSQDDIAMLKPVVLVVWLSFTSFPLHLNRAGDRSLTELEA